MMGWLRGFIFLLLLLSLLLGSTVGPCYVQAWILWAWTVLGDAPRACTALLHCTSWFLLGALFLHWTKI